VPCLLQSTSYFGKTCNKIWRPRVYYHSAMFFSLPHLSTKSLLTYPSLKAVLRAGEWRWLCYCLLLNVLSPILHAVGSNTTPTYIVKTRTSIRIEVPLVPHCKAVVPNLCVADSQTPGGRFNSVVPWIHIKSQYLPSTASCRFSVLTYLLISIITAKNKTSFLFKILRNLKYFFSLYISSTNGT
jgi:hypothetical protein